MARVTGVERATGRGRAEWFEVLDAWGALGRPFREIADWLTGEHGLSRWWAQKLIVEYEQERGVRPPGVRRDGTFEVGASKTVGVPVDDAFEAFVNARRRKRWLTDVAMSLTASDPGRSARFLCEDGATRVVVTFEQKGASRSTISVSHARLTGADHARRTKAQWRQRLAQLKTFLES